MLISLANKCSLSSIFCSHTVHVYASFETGLYPGPLETLAIWEFIKISGDPKLIHVFGLLFYEGLCIENFPTTMLPLFNTDLSKATESSES